MGVAYRAGDHVFHVLPQCQFMAKFRLIRAPRDLIPLADPNPLTYSDGDSFIRFRAYPDPRLFEVIGVQPESVLTVSLLHEPSVPLDSEPILHSSGKSANWLRTRFLVWRICAKEAPFWGESAELRCLPHGFRAPLHYDADFKTNGDSTKVVVSNLGWRKRHGAGSDLARKRVKVGNPR
jgi:hypothetical protein